MEGEIRVVDDVPSAFASLLTDAFANSAASRDGVPFRLAASGGNSGAACYAALASSELDFSKIEMYFVDERCVEATTTDSNQFAIAQVLGDQRDRLAGFFPMSCDEGAEVYEQRVRSLGHFDLIQLGLGPDGHTASLFPHSAALDLPSNQLVAMNLDPSGTNVYQRMTLTYGALSLGSVVVVTVIGKGRANVLREIVEGSDYPASRLHAAELIWLVDRAAGSLLEGATP